MRMAGDIAVINCYKRDVADRVMVAGDVFATPESWLRQKPGVKWRRMEPDVLAAWVADMDFPTPEPVQRALQRVLDDGDLGYADWRDGTPLRAVFAERMSRRFGWDVDPSLVREVTDVVQGVMQALYLGTEVGDAVAVHIPAYPPFLNPIIEMGRRVVPIPMVDSAAGWRFDLERLDHGLRVSRSRAMVLVNPHNPTGRVFTDSELRGLADLAQRHDLLVVSDEIHADLVCQPSRHIPFAALSDDTASRTVTVTSASRAFNHAAARCAVAHYGPNELLGRRDRQPPGLFGAVGVFGVAAAVGAWVDGDAWLAGLVDHLDGQRRLLAETLASRAPMLRHHSPEAGYLAWIDFGALGWGDNPMTVLYEKGRVRLSPGTMFGPSGAGFARLNFATSGLILEEVLNRVVVTALSSSTVTT
ncbi:MAG TPA: aminotransferase class I/II-fold pyridoxal phosphate-dependent enzyme [Pseudonocardiaceae bacterium]|jgi:cystathionine beta-lyase